jgi:hypothetical protein
MQALDLDKNIKEELNPRIVVRSGVDMIDY